MSFHRFGKAIWTVGAWTAAIGALMIVSTPTNPQRFLGGERLHRTAVVMAVMVLLGGLLLMAGGYVISRTCGDGPPQGDARVEALEQQVREMAARLVALEEAGQPAGAAEGSARAEVAVPTPPQAR